MNKRVFIFMLFTYILLLTGCTSINELPKDLQMPKNYQPTQIRVSASVYASSSVLITDQKDIMTIIDEFYHLSFKVYEDEPSLIDLASIVIGDYLYLVDDEGTVYMLNGTLTIDNSWYESSTKVDMTLFTDYLTA